MAPTLGNVTATAKEQKSGIRARISTFSNVFPVFAALVFLAGQAGAEPFFRYTGSFLPSAEGWRVVNFASYESTAATLENGILRIIDSGNRSGTALVYAREWGPTDGLITVAEFDMAVHQASGTYAVYISTSDNRNHMAYQLMRDRIIPSFRIGTTDPVMLPAIMMDLTVRRTIRAELESGQARLYVDNQLVFSGGAADSYYTTVGVTFGAGSSSAMGDFSIFGINCYQSDSGTVPEGDDNHGGFDTGNPNGNTLDNTTNTTQTTTGSGTGTAPEAETDSEGGPNLTGAENGAPILVPGLVAPLPTEELEAETVIQVAVSISPFIIINSWPHRHLKVTMEIPEGYSACDLNLDTILLDDYIPVIPALRNNRIEKGQPVVHDGSPLGKVKNGNIDEAAAARLNASNSNCGRQMVDLVFDMQVFIRGLSIDNAFGYLEIPVSGSFKDGTPFEGSDTIIFTRK